MANLGSMDTPKSSVCQCLTCIRHKHTRDTSECVHDVAEKKNSYFLDKAWIQHSREFVK